MIEKLKGLRKITSAVVIGTNCGSANPLTQFVPNETSCQSIPGLGEVCPAGCWNFEEDNLLVLEAYFVYIDDNNRRELARTDSLEYIIEEGGRMSLCELDGRGCESIEYVLNGDELTLKFLDECELDAGFNRKN